MNGSVAADAGTPLGVLVFIAIIVWSVLGTIYMLSARKNSKR